MSANGYPSSIRSSSPFRLFTVLLVNCLWVGSLLLASASAANASDTYTVTVNTDDYSGTPATLTGTASHCPANGTGSSCTLRDAITAANAVPGSTVKFSVKGTNTLAFVLPVITANMTITGPGANALTISGGYQQFSVSGQTTTVTIAGLTLANANNTVVGAGLMPSYGGAIYNLGSALTVDHVVFSNNTTGQPSLAGEGGAILNNNGSLTVNDCLFIGNYAQNTTPYNGLGGAITNIGTLNINGTTFVGNMANDGSAIYSLNGLTLTGSTFTGNYAGFSGAITFTSGTLMVKDSTFVANTTGFGPNDGTAIYNDGNPAASPAALVMTNSIMDVPTTGAACVTTATPSDCPANGENGNVVALASDLKLAPLGYYGGPTETMLPLAGSVAHCASASSNFPGADQRGFGADFSCGAGLVDAGSVQANYLTVNVATDDPGSTKTTCGTACTLRDAINTALAENNGDINFASGLTGSTITLGAALPTINTSGSVNIVGPGANQLSISGASTYQVFNIAQGTVNLSGMTLGGKTASSGGGINNTGGTVTLSNVAVSNSTATGNGGGINNGGTLLASDSTFSGNKAASGSAIYNTGALKLTYSTVSGNTVTASGGIYNASGAVSTIVNSTFAGNTGGTGSGINNSGALSMTNSVLDATAECAGTGCPTASVNGNVVGATHLAALGLYGGSTPTILPQPGSSAICGGSVVYTPFFVTADQRGFLNENVTYSGYSSTTPCVDAGAVQTNYTGVQFVGTPPYVAMANVPGQTPPVIVSVLENGQNIGGVPVTLTFSGTGSATGLTATTVGGSGANFSAMVVNQPSTSTDTLSVNLTVVGADTLTAGPVDLTVKGQALPTIKFTVANHNYGNAPFAVSATSNSTGAITYSVVSGPATISGSTVTLTGVGTVVLKATQAAAGNYGAGSLTASFTVAPGFTITSLPGTENVYGGDIAIFLLELQASSGFNGKVTLSCSGGPANSICINFPMTVTFFNGSALALSGIYFPPNTKVGTYNLTVTGVSGSVSASGNSTFILQNWP
jgi:CSLREA domain-containing protein